MLSLLLTFALGMVPVVIIAVMIIAPQEPSERRQLLRHPISETRHRLAGDRHDTDSAEV